MTNKPILALHDLSCFGRSALQVIIPTLASFGYLTCPVPTAVLSTHTGGFDDYTFLDLSSHMKEQLEHWKALSLSFSAIYPGFLGSSEQVEIVKDYINTFKKENTLLLVDPVLGDDGTPYSSISDALIREMRQLTNNADIITPNITEANLLLEYAPDYLPKEKDYMSYLTKLASLKAKKIIVTSIPTSEDTLTLLYHDEKNAFKLTFPRIEGSYPGTGDIFCSLILGYLLKGQTIQTAIINATSFLAFAIKETSLLATPIREGLAIEPALLKREASENNPFHFKLEPIR